LVLGLGCSMEWKVKGEGRRVEGDGWRSVVGGLAGVGLQLGGGGLLRNICCLGFRLLGTSGMRFW
jgi:hypothetical protein